MSFAPIQTGGRGVLGARFGYSVKESKGNLPRLRISICSDLLRKMGCEPSSHVRLDIDRTTGHGRLLIVMGRSKHTRRITERTSTTGRGHYEMPWTGEVPLFFPKASMTEMTVLEVKADELTFELPVAVKKGAYA